MIQAITDVFGQVLLFIYNNTGQNYGIAIILLTIIIRLITFPLTHKQLASAKAMQDLQPHIKKIQEKYKDDKEKINQETMNLWKEHKVNPAAGCLPLLVQFPILIAIFRLLQEPSQLEGIKNFVFIGLDMTRALYVGGIWQTNIGYYLLVLFSGFTTFYQQKIMMTDKSQQTMLYVMPVMLLVFSARFPAGLVLYWVISNVLSIGHHFLLNKPVAEGALKQE